MQSRKKRWLCGKPIWCSTIYCSGQNPFVRLPWQWFLKLVPFCRCHWLWPFKKWINILTFHRSFKGFTLPEFPPQVFYSALSFIIFATLGCYPALGFTVFCTPWFSYSALGLAHFFLSQAIIPIFHPRFSFLLPQVTIPPQVFHFWLLFCPWLVFIRQEQMRVDSIRKQEHFFQQINSKYCLYLSERHLESCKAKSKFVPLIFTLLYPVITDLNLRSDQDSRFEPPENKFLTSFVRSQGLKVEN